MRTDQEQHCETIPCLVIGGRVFLWTASLDARLSPLLVLRYFPCAQLAFILTDGRVEALSLHDGLDLFQWFRLIQIADLFTVRLPLC